MTKIYLTRHCETLWNAEKRMQGWSDGAPSERGIAQAQALAERMKSVHLDAIYSSPTGRALFTATQSHAHHACEIVTDDRLREIHLGRWEGMLESDLRAHDAQRYHSFWKDPVHYITDGGESFEEVGARMKNFFDEVVLQEEGKTILVVSHTVAIRTFSLLITGRTISELWKDAQLKPTSVTEISLSENSADIITWGDSSHIEKISAV